MALNILHQRGCNNDNVESQDSSKQTARPTALHGREHGSRRAGSHEPFVSICVLHIQTLGEPASSFFLHFQKGGARINSATPLFNQSWGGRCISHPCCQSNARDQLEQQDFHLISAQGAMGSNLVDMEPAQRCLRCEGGVARCHDVIDVLNFHLLK